MRAGTVQKIMQETRVVIVPTRAEIAARAHALYVERAPGEGTELEDWLQAERELLEERLLETPVTQARVGVRHTTAHDLASK